MGRGRGRGRRGGRGGSRGGRKGGRGGRGGSKLSRRDKRHLKEYGEAHPVADVADEDGTAAYRDHDVRPSKRMRMEEKQSMRDAEMDAPSSDSSSEGEEDSDNEKTAYQKLLSTLGHGQEDSSSEEEVEQDSDADEATELVLTAEELEAKRAELGTDYELVPADANEASDGSSEAEDDDGDGADDSDEDGSDAMDGVEYGDDNDTAEEANMSQDPRKVQFKPTSDELAQLVEQTDALARQKFGKSLLDSAVFGQAAFTMKPGTSEACCSSMPSLEIERSAVRARLKVPSATLKSGREVLSLPPPVLETFAHVDTYRDFLLTQRTHENKDELRAAYVTHALNHVLKKRSEILRNNERLKKNPDLEIQDMGYSRCSVLILVPYRSCALQVVNAIMSLLLEDEDAKFRDEFGFDGEVEHPNEEFRKIFDGNSDDCFQIGMSVNRSSLHLYSSFYKSDIIIASPLGLRMQIGGEGDKERDRDFLASVEVCIVDQAESMMMQNWSHVNHIFDNLNQIPSSPRDTDMSRVQSWALDGLAKYFRQTICLSAYACPELSALFSRRCFNRSGKVKFVTSRNGVLQTVLRELPQTFRRLPRTTAKEVADARFNEFVSEILPNFSAKVMSHILIFIPSYFDFVRIRNYFKKEEKVFGQICEYTTNANVSRTRSNFYHGRVKFLLYTERYHYHFRPNLRGIKHVVFFGVPTNPDIYAEILNMVDSPEATSVALYSPLDVLALDRLVGTVRSQRMLAAQNSVHLFV